MTRVSKKTSKKMRYVSAWLEEDVAQVIDQAVSATESDNSKFIRSACRERLVKLGFKVPEKQPAKQPA